MTTTTPRSRPAAGALVAIGVGLLLLIALVVAAVVITPALLATPARATLTVTVTGPDGSPVDETGRQDAAAVLAGRLDAADIPNSVFDDEGAADFADATAELAATGGQFAILVDGEVIIAPRVMAAITDGAPQISGSFDRQSAEFLAARLRLAAYDAALSVSAVDVSE